MAGVLGRMRGSERRLVESHIGADLRALELQEAKAILCEIFCISVSEVEEMIRNRFEEAACHLDEGSEEEGLWPQEFWIEG